MGTKLYRVLSILLIILPAFVFPNLALAQEQPDIQLKPYYLCGRLGYSNITYPVELEDAFDLADTHIGGIGIDLAAYIPLPGSNNTIVGIDASGALDSYTYPGFLWESASVTITHVLFSLSSMYFFREIGLGPFVKAGAGLSRLEVDVSDIFWEFGVTSDFGIGFLLGAGIAFPASYNAKVLLDVDYSSRRVEGEDYKILGLNIGVLY